LAVKAMIISVGGTPQPIVKSLMEHKPKFVCFFASQQSLDVIGSIKDSIKKHGLKIDDYKIICDDADDLVHCYEKAVHCTAKLKEKKISPEEVVVDYTGGTKTMTAALALATIGHGYIFSYVGGRERTKEGLGTVVTGTEIVKTGVSPWQIFAVEEKKRVALLVSSYQYEAAIRIIQMMISEFDEKDAKLWGALGQLIEGYRCWDSFDHSKAVKELSSGLKAFDLFRNLNLLSAPLEQFHDRTKANFEILTDMSQKTGFFKKMHPILVADLVSNARRRAVQNKYDDAVARLYRALEMVGQIAFMQRTGCPTSDVDPQVLPESLRDEFICRYTSPLDNKIKIPLYATFQVLAMMGDATGLKFMEHEEDFKGVISARNNSIYAHGLSPVKRDTYEKFELLIRSHFVDGPLVEFPKLEMM